jgi:hypothetical protein
MFVVPLIGDSIDVGAGVTHTVLSYAALKDQPAVYVESEGADTQSVEFSAIKKINGTPVTLSTSKIFTASSLVKRTVQLPQPGDKVTVGGQVLKVKALKLREHGKLTNGLLVAGVPEGSDEVTTVRASQIDRIERANGDTNFKRAAFLSLYKEFLGVKG